MHSKPCYAYNEYLLGIMVVALWFDMVSRSSRSHYLTTKVLVWIGFMTKTVAPTQGHITSIETREKIPLFFG